jgi:hypothetical protein
VLIHFSERYGRAELPALLAKAQALFARTRLPQAGPGVSEYRNRDQGVAKLSIVIRTAGAERHHPDIDQLLRGYVMVLWFPYR